MQAVFDVRFVGWLLLDVHQFWLFQPRITHHHFELHRLIEEDQDHFKNLVLVLN